MPWTVLLFAAGSLAIPAPSILLVPPHPSSQEDPIHIACVAPGGFPGANFTLYRGRQVVQLLQAPADQLRVTFNLTGGGREAPGGTFHCQYEVLGEQPQLSDLSDTVSVSFPVPTWILALSLSLAGALLLLAGMVTIAVVVRRVKVKKMQKKRERESCWAQINFATTDMTFDNSLFAISPTRTLKLIMGLNGVIQLGRCRTGMEPQPALTYQALVLKMNPEDPATLDACSGSVETSGNSGPRKRPTSTSSSPEPPEFSTFRACQ
ncbi:protein HIDE1 isoform X1 [Leopardus geoffroyi]|uniref:protein HIDE1 isoform X1 n=1 Tax=Leopardus geoffroyi TaxID=46844 RepID=UPI001E265789|nr:protein HIDE1 isoform X1 [Leopardus geoffroyi]